MSSAQLYLPFDKYILVRDGDSLASQIANRHYSRIWAGNINQKRFMPPGRRLILLCPQGSWVFAWSQQKYRRDGQTGVECNLFRNESCILSSEIIGWAEQVWDEKFGCDRKFTYVHPGFIRSSNPGFCFQKAGWRKVKGYRSKRGLFLLVKECEHYAHAT